ncbi:dinuclear metal center protein, YbgI/SA1388 family [Desulfuromusa kysingii]|uniref:GTP cyclohydrolase 1 type 2 homolog n=1 Tax=Desulfuromusa kysingii TaxID=37625 RepID=A0A1H3XCG4_9BACT|nr:Nif3-like dinuclear metal center hexameric protein [Desulfuromusa kysingii]SDZ97023.1 dinuclear metal center protein, YbgI/SA1388 family [Desulfuromusa kysingii]
MAKQKIACLADIIGLLNRLCPPVLAEDWDNVGLQVGDPRAKIDKILISLDPEEIAIEAAHRCGAQLLISHHPLIFRPLKRLSPTDMTGRVLFQAIKHDIAVVCAHTNLDRAADGLNDWLAARLGVTQTTPLEAPEPGHYYKLVVYVPLGHEEKVRDAILAAGAGRIGAYDRVSFSSHGVGTFRGDQGTDAFIGAPGESVVTEEVRLETIVPPALIQKVVSRMLKAHPYEEVAYDLISLANQRTDVGLGRIGQLEQAVPLQQFTAQVKGALNLSTVKIVGDLERKIKRVAVCGGTGMSLFSAASRQGADCLVTADIKFHEAQRARAEGVALIDAGHFATEQIMVVELSKRLRKVLSRQNLEVEVIEMTAESDPFILF